MIIHGKKLKMLTKRDDPGLTPQSFYNSIYLMIMTLQCVIIQNVIKTSLLYPKPSTNSENQGLKQRLLRVNVEHPTTSSSGVYEPKCIFCNKVTKSSGKDKREYLGSLEVESSEVKIKEAAVKLQDNVLLAVFSGPVHW